VWWEPDTQSRSMPRFSTGRATQSSVGDLLKDPSLSSPHAPATPDLERHAQRAHVHSASKSGRESTNIAQMMDRKAGHEKLRFMSGADVYGCEALSNPTVFPPLGDMTYCD